MPPRIGAGIDAETDAGPSTPRRTQQWVPLALLAGLFVVSRAAYSAGGVTFDAGPLHWYSQYLPVDLLQDDLLTSIVNLHAQPPLFNLLLGTVVNVTTATAGTFRVLYLGMGLALVLSLYLLMADLGVPRYVAVAAATLFGALPSTVVTENILFYPYPVALLLTVGMLCAGRYLRTQGAAFGVAASAAFTAVVLTRATFHLAWLVVVVLLMVLASRRRARRMVLVMLPVALAVCWYGKNLVLFDATSGSTWSGMNIASVDLVQAPKRELHEMVARRDLSRQALLPPFQDLGAYGVELPHTGVPALDRPTKGGEFPNYNNEAYIGVSDRYLSDTIRYATAHPDAVARNFVTSLQLFFMPVAAADRVCQGGVVGHLCDVEHRLVDGQARTWHPTSVIHLQPGAADHAPGVANITWLRAIEYAVVIVAGFVVLWRVIRRVPLDARAATIGLIAFTVLWEVVFANVFELGENARFRFETDPITWAACVALAAMGLRALRRPDGQRSVVTRSASPESPERSEPAVVATT